MNYDFDPVYVQTNTAKLQSELSDLKTRLELQESETRNANSKFQFSMTETEKLKTSFEVERNAWEFLVVTHNFEPAYAQDTTAQLECQLADMKARLEVPESKTPEGRLKIPV